LGGRPPTSCGVGQISGGSQDVHQSQHNLFSLCCSLGCTFVVVAGIIA
jgi:hypothetical protein